MWTDDNTLDIMLQTRVLRELLSRLEATASSLLRH